MAEELISEYIDQAAIKSQTDFLVQQLERAKTQYKSLSDAIKNIQKSTTFTDTAKITAQAEKEQQALLKTQQQIIKAKQEQVKLENQLLQQQILQEKQAQANLKTTQAQSKVKTSVVTESITKPGFADDVTKAGAVVSAFDKQQAEAAISATEFGNSLNRQAKIIKDEVTPAVKATTLTAKQLALAKAEGAVLAAKETAALKNQIREELAVKGSLEQRRAALIRLNAVYDAQGPSERASAAGQRLQKIIGGLDTQVKSLEQTTGRSQRNVGNYPDLLGKIGDGAKKAFSGIRTLANILPGLGLSGVFLLGYEAILKVIEALGLLKTKAFDVSQQRAVLGEISEKATESYAKEGVKLRLLSSEYQNANTTTIRRKDIQKELNALAPAYFSNLDSEAQFMNTIAEKTERVSQALLIKAKIEAASGLLTTKYKELLDKQFDPTKALSFNDKLKSSTRDLGTLLRNIFNVNAVTPDDIVDIGKRAEKGVKKAETEYTAFEDFIKKFIFGANLELEKLGGDPGKGSGVKAAKKSQEKLSDLLDESFERYKLKQQRLLDILNEGANDEANVYENRLKFLEDFNREQKNLIDNQEIFELQKNENKKLAAIKAAKGNAKEIAIVTANAEEAAKTISLKAQLDILKADEDYYKRKLKLREDYNKVQQDFADQEYEYERLLNEKLEKLRQDRLKGMKDFEDKDKKDMEDKKKRAISFLETLQGYYNQLSSIISGAFSIGTTKRKNEAQEAIEAIEAQRDADLKANEARVQSEQDKAANIAIINSRADQQKKQQEQRQREADRRQAQAEKALSIFSITLSIAKAVASHLGKPYLIALDLALGAAQLAVAAATPIPKFKHGKRRGQAYEGPGIVNDGPNMEVIERADGSIEMPAGRNVLTHVGANDIIHPDRERWVNSVLNAAMRDSNVKQKVFAKGDNQLAAAMAAQVKLLKQIADKPVAKTYASDRGLAQVVTWGVNQVKYIEQQTNWK